MVINAAILFDETPVPTASPTAGTASLGSVFSQSSLLSNNKQLITFAVIFGLVVLMLVLMTSKQQSLSSVKLKTAGDGQYGRARFMTREEALHPEKFKKQNDGVVARKTMKDIVFDPKKWREKPQTRPDTPGVLLGDWHVGGKKSNAADWPYYINSKGEWTGGTVHSLLNYQDCHVQVTAGSGTGKTACFLLPQLEYGCACGISMLVTDTKGDIARDYAPIAKKYYGYNSVTIDLRNPMASAGFNILHMVNKYQDKYDDCPDKTSPEAIAFRAKEENFAKIVAKTIIMQGNNGEGYGQNAFFYESAEGLLAACILIVAGYTENKDERHIVSVYKLVQSICGVDEQTGETNVQKLLDNLPEDSDIRMLAGSAAQNGGDAQANVISTAMSKMLAFIDKETEQILCFKSDIDAEDFCRNKTLIVLTMAEEHPERYFIVSLIIQELYRELLKLADENQDNPGKVPMTAGFLNTDSTSSPKQKKSAAKKSRIMFYLDEFGTLPPVAEADKMFSAARSRHIFLVPIVQGNIQLEKNYGKAGASIIKDNCAIQIFSGQSPQSDDSDKFSKDLGSYTVESGNVSQSSRSGGSTNSHSSSRSLMKRELMTADEIRTMPTGTWIVMMTGRHPMKINMDLFLDWGMPPIDELPAIEQHKAKKVEYAKLDEIEAKMRDEKNRPAQNAVRNEEAAEKSIAALSQPEQTETKQADSDTAEDSQQSKEPDKQAESASDDSAEESEFDSDE